MQLPTFVKPALLVCLAFGAGLLCAPTFTAQAQDGTRGQDPGQEPGQDPKQDPGQGDPAKPPAKNSVVLEALGGAVSFECYASCGYLGALADGFQAGGYPAQYIRVRTMGLAGGLANAVKQLKALESAPLTPGDKQVMIALRKILENIVKQCKALAKYAETKDAAQAKAFRELRAKTWADLARTIGLGKATNLLAPGGSKLGLGK